MARAEGSASRIRRGGASWGTALCVIGVVGCVTASRDVHDESDAGDDRPRTLADAGVDGARIADAGSSDDVTGSFGHCCVDGKLLSCFCPTGATCRFGVACDAGGCSDVDGGECDRVMTDGAAD